MTTRTARYTHVAILLHWAIAAAIVFQIALGWRMETEKGQAAFALFQLHKSIGITILLLSVARLVWRLMNPPPPIPDQPRWERIVSHSVHGLFYVMLIGLPLTGWAIVSSSRIAVPTVLYGVIPWPHLPLAGMTGVHDAAESGHGLLVWLTLALLALHLGAVAKHQFLDRDTVFARMMPAARAGLAEPRFWLVIAAVIGLMTAAKLIQPALKAAPVQAEASKAVELPEPAERAPETSPKPENLVEAVEEAADIEASDWAVQPGGSLTFTADWAGSAIEGRFARWDADIRFAPDALEDSRLSVSVDIASAATGDSQRDTSLPTADWFDASAHPRAIFTATDFRKLSDTRYEARGTLTMRGVSRPLTVAFTLRIEGDTATASGSATIDRTRFGVGQGEWAATDQIAASVKVRFNLTARRKG